MSIQRHGRAMATPQSFASVPTGAAVSSGAASAGAATSSGAAAPAGVGAAPTAVSQEVVDFIRYCYQRRRIGWPELYDEMCGVAARGEFRGMDYDRLATLGVRFSLCDMPRLASLAHRVVVDERRRRVAIPIERSPIPVEVVPPDVVGEVGPKEPVASELLVAPLPR